MKMKPLVEKIRLRKNHVNIHNLESRKKWSLEVEVKGTGNRWNHVYIQGNTLIDLPCSPSPLSIKKKERIYSKLVMMSERRRDKTFKYFQSGFWDCILNMTAMFKDHLNSNQRKILNFCTWCTSWWQEISW